MYSAQILFLALFLTAGGLVKDMTDTFKSVPRRIDKWETKTKDQVFDEKTIFKYINGGAELYLAYDFRSVLARKYVDAKNREIVLDIYIMGSAEDAFGVFGSEREGPGVGIGQGSEFADGLLRFWKGPYFVSIFSMENDKATAKAMTKLAKAVADAIPMIGAEPVILSRLPQKNLVGKQIYFFHTQMLLNKHYYVSDRNILDLGPDTDCALGRYAVKSADPAIALACRYKTDTAAKKAHKKFLAAYMPETSVKKPAILKTENKKWTTTKIDRNVVSVIFDAQTKRAATDLLAAVQPAHRGK